MIKKLPISKDFKKSTRPLFVPIHVNSRMTGALEKYMLLTNPDITARIAGIDQANLLSYNGCIITIPSYPIRSFVVAPVRKHAYSFVEVDLKTLCHNIGQALRKVGESSIEVVREYMNVGGFQEQSYLEFMDELEKEVDVYEYRL